VVLAPFQLQLRFLVPYQTGNNWSIGKHPKPLTPELFQIQDQNIDYFFRNTVLMWRVAPIRGLATTNNRWPAAVQANNVQLGRLGQVPPGITSTVEWRFNLSGTIRL